MEEIDISKMDKAEVLAALYNNSTPQGMGFLNAENFDMSKETAEEILNSSKNRYFDYLKGRVLKVDLVGDSFAPFLYDRDNGSGAAERAIKHLSKD